MPYSRSVYPDLEIFKLMGKRPEPQGIQPAPTQGAVSQQDGGQKTPSILDNFGAVRGVLEQNGQPWWATSGIGDDFALGAEGAAFGVPDSFALAEASALNPLTEMGMVGAAPGVTPAQIAAEAANLGLGGAAGGGLFSSFGGGIGAGLAANPWLLPGIAGVGILGGILDWW